MFFKTPLKTFLFQAANIIVGLSLIICCTVVVNNILKTVRFARFVGLDTIKPEPMDYIWQISINHAAIDKNTIRYWVDYYENLLKVFPDAVDAYGVLGYCYHYLGNDLKAQELFKKASAADPAYFWYSYDLAILYLKNHHYHESLQLLQKTIQLDPSASLKAMASSGVLDRLLPQGSPAQEIATHLGQGYKQGFLLLNILNPSLEPQKADDIIKRLQLEIYVF